MSVPPGHSAPKTDPRERTQLVEAPAFNASGKAWRKFQFKSLEQVSRTSIILTERLAELLPPAAVDGRVTEAVLKRLKELLEVDGHLYLDHVQVIKPKELPRFASQPTYLTTLSPAPHKARGFLEIELGLAHAIIDLMLGGAGEAVAMRPLTDIEEGMMGFVVLESLKALAPNVEPGLPRLRFEGQGKSPAEAAEALAEETQLVLVQLKGVLGPHAGYVRLFIPGSLVGSPEPLKPGPERTARRRSRIAHNISRLHGVKTWLRAEIGRAEILARDLASVRLKDVVLLDEHSARPDKGEGGTVRLKIGAGRTGHLDAQLFMDNGKFRAKIARFVPGEAPRPPAEPEAQLKPRVGQATEPPVPVGEPEDPTGPDEPTDGERKRVEDSTFKNEGSELLNDIPLQVAVELARIPLSAEEVVSLKVGQVVDLNRVSGEPVELSVNGKVVAKGELVEVDGHLGVRVLSVVG